MIAVEKMVPDLKITYLHKGDLVYWLVKIL